MANSHAAVSASACRVGSNATMLDGGEPEPFNSLLVTCNFFAVYGLARPRLGRVFCSTSTIPGFDFLVWDSAHSIPASPQAAATVIELRPCSTA
jgi:hypothetical protein